MRLIVGLGNPGEKYKNTLHNVGFNAIDSLASEVNENKWADKFKGSFTKGNFQSKQFVLLKPLTYMNASGESVLACLQFFKIDITDLLVISDDIDLPVGKLRHRTSGGHGGHNGLRSIIQLCGDNNFHRLRIGIGRPQSAKDVSGYVLGKPSPENRELINQAVKEAIEFQLDFILNRALQVKISS